MGNGATFLMFPKFQTPGQAASTVRNDSASWVPPGLGRRSVPVRTFRLVILGTTGHSERLARSERLPGTSCQWREVRA